MRKMKKCIQLIAFIIISGNVFAQGGQPEIYIHIKDYQGGTFRYHAIKDGNEPIYDKDYFYTSKYYDVYDHYEINANDTTIKDFTLDNNEISANKGFDWVGYFHGQKYIRGTLGFAKYKIEVQKFLSDQWVVWFDFFVDYRQNNSNGCPDFRIKIYKESEGQFNSTYRQYLDNQFDSEYITFSQGDLLEVWTMAAQDKDWSLFAQNIPVKNDVGGNVDTTLTTELLEKLEGFPVDENDYPIGHQFTANDTVPFWKQATYKFEAVTEIVNDYKIRNWNNRCPEGENLYGKIGYIKLKSDDNSVTSVYQPTHPLTVNNYLEGGSGGTYDVHWQAAGTTETGINSGVSYDAFEYRNPTLDKYNITVPSSISSAYGTSWYFIEWDDGTYNTTLSNFQVTAPTTKTAYYKGNMRSDDANAYSNSGQRKVLRLSNGSIYMVYESMGRVWIEADYANGQHIVELLDEG